MVIWIIGLSGTGKSYLAKKIFTKLVTKKKIIIDGDEVRKYITNKERQNTKVNLTKEYNKFFTLKPLVFIV